MIQDPYSPPEEEKGIADYEIGDLPLDVEEDTPEILQILQSPSGHEFMDEDAWIGRALAAIRVREAVMLYALGPEKKEQERTKRAKELFLEAYASNMGSITASCASAMVERSTYYTWLKVDPIFRTDVYELDQSLLGHVEDALKEQISQKDGASIRYFLDRRHPEYKPKGTLDVVHGHRTFEDLLYEEAARRRKIALENKAQVVVIEQSPNGNGNNHTTSKPSEQVGNAVARVEA